MLYKHKCHVTGNTMKPSLATARLLAFHMYTSFVYTGVNNGKDFFAQNSAQVPLPTDQATIAAILVMWMGFQWMLVPADFTPTFTRVLQ